MENDAIYDALRLFGRRWTLEILSSLSSGPKRFNNIQRDAGNINSKSHRDALRRLVDRGLVLHPTQVDGVHYVLTPLGERAMPALRSFVIELTEWGHTRDDEPSPRI